MKKYLLPLILVFLFVGCGHKKPIYQQPVTYYDLYKPLYDENPVSILILPALDKTTSAEASELFSYTITTFLAEKGYYVFSPSLVDEFLKSENITEPKMARKISIEKLKEVFNPDAILYVDITDWNTNYKVLSSGVSVGMSHKLVSTKTKEHLWSKYASSSSVAKGQLDSGSIEGFLVSAVVSAVVAAANTTTDYQKLALEANHKAYIYMPHGKYHYDYEKQKIGPYGYIEIDNTDIEHFNQKRKTDPNHKFTYFVTHKDYKDTEVYSSAGIVIKTDSDGKIITKDGKVQWEKYTYKKDNNTTK